MVLLLPVRSATGISDYLHPAEPLMLDIVKTT